VGQQAKEAVLVSGLRVRRDERPLALAAHEDVVERELVDRLAHGALAHAIALRELELRRDRLAGLPLARFQALREQPLDLLVERAERRRDHSSLHPGYGSTNGWRFPQVLYKIQLLQSRSSAELLS